MKIDDLPVEMLMTIFSYLPSFQKVLLVNKTFYGAVCKLWDSKLCLKLKGTLFVDEQRETLQSIQNSYRKIRDLRITFDSPTKSPDLNSVLPIVRHFSTTLKILRVDGVVKPIDVIQMLSILPNVEHLVFNGTFNNNYEPFQILSIEGLNLTKLKTLDLHTLDHEFVVMFNKLPENVLTEIILIDHDLNNLNELFKRQRKIKKSTINRSRLNSSFMVPVDFFDNQQLESLEWQSPSFDNNNFEIILSKQLKLKSLILTSALVSKDLMNVVTNNLTDLETLSVTVFESVISALKSIKKLKKMKILELDSNDLTTNIEKFGKFENSRITTLNITFQNVSTDTIKTLAMSVPNLKVFTFRCNNIIELEIFDAIMTNFNYIEILHIRGYYNYSNFNGNLIPDNCGNPKLVELQVRTMCNATNFLETLIASYPNLRELKLMFKKLFASQLKLILKGFKKLESLNVAIFNTMPTIAELDYFADHGKHLQFMLVMNLSEFIIDMKITDKIKKKLSATYDVIACCGSIWILAVDRNTMYRLSFSILSCFSRNEVS